MTTLGIQIEDRFGELNLYNPFVFDNEEDHKNFDEAMKHFDKHCSPKKNETFECYMLHMRTQRPGELFDSFVTDLRLKAQSCNFSDLKPLLILHQIIFGLLDDKLWVILLREEDLVLGKAVKVCQASVITTQIDTHFAQKELAPTWKNKPALLAL